MMNLNFINYLVAKLQAKFGDFKKQRISTLLQLILILALVSPSRTSAQLQNGKPPDLSGSWTVTTFGATWKVELAAQKDSADTKGQLFCGLAVQEKKRKKDTTTTSLLCALWIPDKNVIRISVLGAVICEAPFKSEGSMQGACVMKDMNGGPTGAFIISRNVSPK